MIITQATFQALFGWEISQHRGMIGEGDASVLLTLSRLVKPSMFVEIGIQQGVTAYEILRHGPWIKRYIGVDVTPEHTPTLACQKGEVPTCAGAFAANDHRLQVLTYVNGSRDLDPKRVAGSRMWFIDGDHSYDGVLADTHLALDAVRDGVICWHDYRNPAVPSVTAALDDWNTANGAVSQICWVEGTHTCFMFRR